MRHRLWLLALADYLFERLYEGLNLRSSTHGDPDTSLAAGLTSNVSHSNAMLLLQSYHDLQSPLVIPFAGLAMRKDRHSYKIGRITTDRSTYPALSKAGLAKGATEHASIGNDLTL